VNAKTGQANGLCRPITNGTDPDNECAQEATSTCGRDGQCDGAGACRAWAAGITCVLETCSGTTYTPTRVCNGAGTCLTVTTASCGNYACGAMTCKTTCVSNNDCAPNNFCSATGTCVGQKANGASCVAADECASGFCTDGVCCVEACGGGCSACSNAKTGQNSGLCLPVTAGTDPDNECPQDAASSCGLDGQCNGAGACRYWGTTTTCVGESCLGSTHTLARTCNGSGTCQAATTEACSPYVCGTTACKTTCASALDCTSGFFCSSAGNCTTVKANGAACGAPDECSSNSCMDGVCCESACTGGCFACSAAKTAQADGLCRAIVGGTDPDSECTQDSAMSCGNDGFCDGAGACRKYVAGSTCVPESCSGTTYTSAQLCSGAGTCGAATTSGCGAYVCGATSCLTTCTTSADCSTGNYCLAGACVPKEANGTACVGSGECGSGFCVDGVCCNSACGGTCQTCAQSNSVGTCIAADPGTDPRLECDATGAASCGNDGSCDGAGACRKYAAGTECLAAGCTGGAVHTASTCNGTGTCNAGTTTSCGAYQCDAAGAACRTTCTVDSHCTSFCSATACVATPVNLAGNGDVETGTANSAPWTTNGGTLTIQTGIAHAGTYSASATGRTANFNGPAYPVPTGAGSYTISAWAMQNENATQNVALQVNLSCGEPPAGGMFPTVGQFGISLPSGVWTQISGTVNLGANASCQPGATTPGVVRSATLYLNQTAAGSTVAFPNLFLDDVVIRPTAAGLNLVGNPNLEAGTTAGWSSTGGTLSISTTVFKPGGLRSLQSSGRTQTFQGPRWNLPLGAAKYSVTFNGLHSGSFPHDLILQPTYTCAGGSAQFPAPIATASQVGGNGWNTLTGTVTFPPANAAAGCRLTSAGVYMQQEGSTVCATGECPDLFVDDVSITLAP
jgi:hypothetical protein